MSVFTACPYKLQVCLSLSPIQSVFNIRNFFIHYCEQDLKVASSEQAISCLFFILYILIQQ